ncbi:MAG: O-antigen ligase family protein [Chloroflexi bacterium]|nr:O-antigen ligase family protein [Chloroflexota bacterium]
MAHKIPNWLGKSFFVLVIFLLTDSFRRPINFLSHHPFIRNIVVLLTDMPLNETGRAIRLGLRFLVSSSLDAAFWLIILMALFRLGGFVKFREMLWKNMLAVVLVFFGGISVFWSISPEDTLNDFYLVLKITVLGIYLSQVYSLEEILDLLVGVFALASALSILAVWLVPEIGISGRYWQGIYSFKNFLGRLMAFGNAIAILYWLKSGGMVFKRILALVFFILTGVLLVFSKSTTSVLLLLGMYATLIVYGVWRKFPAYWNLRNLGVAALVLGFITSIIAWNWERIYALIVRTPALAVLFLRSPTLSGRTELWEILLGWFQQRPIFGFGYGAFWSLYPDGISNSSTPQMIRHAHNGYLEIALGLGIVGLVIFLVALFLAWKRAFTLLSQRRQIVFILPILALIYFTLANITYSIAFERPDFHWLLFIIVTGLVTSTQLRRQEISP